MPDPEYGKSAYCATNLKGSTPLRQMTGTADHGFEGGEFGQTATALPRATGGDSTKFAAAAQVDRTFNFTIEWNNAVNGTFALFAQNVGKEFSFEFGPFGNTASQTPPLPKATFDAVLTAGPIPAPPDNLSKGALTFQISGDVTWGTY